MNIPHECVLSTCFAPPTAVLVRRGRRAHLRLGRRSVHHGLYVHRLTRGEAKRVREKQSGSAPNLAVCLAMPKAFWDEHLLGHSPGHNVAKSLRVRQLVALNSRSVRSRLNGGGGPRRRGRRRARSAAGSAFQRQLGAMDGSVTSLSRSRDTS